MISSQAYDANGAVGLTSILKVNKNQGNHYYVLDVIISVINVSDEQYKFTNSVEEAPVNNFYRCNVTELTGDFAKYAKELESMQNEKGIVGAIPFSVINKNTKNNAICLKTKKQYNKIRINRGDLL